MAALWAIAAASVAVLGTNVSINASNNAAEDNRKLQAASDFEVRQSATRKRVRERRIAEARLKQGAANIGVGGSSGEAGALSSLATQFASQGSASVFAQQQGARQGEIQNNLESGLAVGQAIKSVGSLIGAYASTIETPKVETPKVETPKV